MSSWMAICRFVADSQHETTTMRSIEVVFIVVVDLNMLLRQTVKLSEIWEGVSPTWRQYNGR